MTGYVRPQSAIGRVRAFYERNPDEELTADDMATKFDLERWQVEKLLYVLRALAFLEAVPGSWPLAYRYTGVPVDAIRWRPQEYRVRDPQRRPNWVRQ